MEPSYALPEFHSNDSPWMNTMTGSFFSGRLSSAKRESEQVRMSESLN
jgi:hypothetical protein